MSDLLIRQAITEVLEGTILGIRPIAEDLLKADYTTGSDLYNQAISALTTPAFDISITYSPSEDNVMQPSLIWIENIEVKITTTFLLDSQVLNPEDYMIIKATSARMGHLIRVAFGWPDKLKYTDAGEDTEIINGMLKFEGMDIIKDQVALVGTDPGLLITEYTFSGWVMTTELVA